MKLNAIGLMILSLLGGCASAKEAQSDCVVRNADFGWTDIESGDNLRQRLEAVLDSDQSDLGTAISAMGEPSRIYGDGVSVASWVSGRKRLHLEHLCDGGSRENYSVSFAVVDMKFTEEKNHSCKVSIYNYFGVIADESPNPLQEASDPYEVIECENFIRRDQ